MNTRFFNLLAALLLAACSARATTAFTYQFYNADGTAQTNAITMTAWPPSTNTWTVYGTNIIYGGLNITLTPNSSGFGTNHAYPGAYRLYVSNLNSGFYVTLPDTTNTVSLGTYLTSAPQTAGPIGFFGMVTNWLGYSPATNTSAGLIATLGYTPLTNTYAAMTNAAGFRFATNTSAGLIAGLGYTPATNTYAAATNLLSFIPNYAGITNALGFRPATNAATMTNLSLSVLVPGSTTNIIHITNGVVNRIGNP